jgi:hypothetical protein
MDLEFICVKIGAIGYYSMIYLLFIVPFSILLNYLMPNLNKAKDDYISDKNDLTIIFEIMMNFALVGIVFYIIRNIAINIPYPLEGFANFKASRLKEIQGGLVASPIFFNFQTKLISKLSYFKKKYNLD